MPTPVTRTEHEARAAAAAAKARAALTPRSTSSARRHGAGRRRSTAMRAHVEALSHLDRGLTLLLSLPASDARDAREIELQLALGLCSITVKGMSASVAPIP